MKTEYDKRQGGATLFQLGDIVKKRNKRRDDRKGDWEQFSWRGPYIIIFVKDGAYYLEDKLTGEQLTQGVAASNLEKYNVRRDDLMPKNDKKTSETSEKTDKPHLEKPSPEKCLKETSSKKTKLSLKKKKPPSKKTRNPSENPVDKSNLLV